MAVKVQLQRGTDTLDLYGNTNGFAIAYDGWARTIAAREESGEWPKEVEEAITLRVSGSSHDDLASIKQSLDEKLLQASDFCLNLTSTCPTFLGAKLSGESASYRSFVFGGATALREGMLGHATSPGMMIRELTLGLRRNPFWEPDATCSVSTQVVATAHGASCLGGCLLYTDTSILGDAPARIDEFEVKANDYLSASLSEFWLGIRSEQHGITASKLVTLWECEDGTPGTDATESSDSNSSGGYRTVVDFGTATTMANRCRLEVNDVTSDYSDQWGTYLVLLKAKATGTRKYNVRIAGGYTYASNKKYYPRVPIDATQDYGNNYFLHPMGQIQIPPGTRRQYRGSSSTSYYGIWIEAEVAVTGTGNLELDCIILIPIDEAALHIKGAQVERTSGTQPCSVYHNVDDTFYCVAQKWVGAQHEIADTPEFSPANWGLPTGPGLVVVAAQADDECNIDEEIWLTMDYYPRWLTLRGDE